MNPKVPAKLLIIDKNKTRFFSTYELAKSNLYLKIPMSTFLIQKNVAPFFLPGDWEFCREVEGVLNIQQSLTTLSQNESRFNGAFAGPIKQRTRNKLVVPTINLRNLDR